MSDEPDVRTVMAAAQENLGNMVPHKVYRTLANHHDIRACAQNLENAFTIMMTLLAGLHREAQSNVQVTQARRAKVAMNIFNDAANAAFEEVLSAWHELAGELEEDYAETSPRRFPFLQLVE